MSEMIKRLAKAIDDVDAHPLHTLQERRARAVLAAMREPTENMLFVGSNDEAGYSADDLATSWRLMIDEALK